MMVLSHYQARIILDAQRSGMDSVIFSLDLGLSTAQLAVNTSRRATPGW